MDNNQQKLDFLLRKNSGMRILEGLKKDIIDKTNIKEISLMPLELREGLWEKFCLLLKNDASRSVLKIENQESSLQAKKLFTQLCRSADKFDCYMFLNHFKDIGAIKMDTSAFFENAINLLEIDRDSIYILSDDLENGIMLDYYESDSGSGWTYEVVIYGQKWSEIFNKFLKLSNASINGI